MAEEYTEQAEPKANRSRGPLGVTAVALLVMIIAVVMALWFYREQQDAETRVQLSQQYIVTALLKPAGEKLVKAEQYVGEMNYGHADEMLNQAVTMFSSASQVLGQFGSLDVLTRCQSSVQDAQQAVQTTSSDALERIQVAKKQIEMAEILVAQKSISWAREQAQFGNFSEAKAFLMQTSTLFEDATQVEGMDPMSGDWRDDVIAGLSKAQKSLNGFADSSVHELDALSQQFNKVGLAKAREYLISAERQIATQDFTDAKRSLMEAATMFEQARQVEGMERQDWIDDVVAGLGTAQKSVNDFAEKATPVIDQSLKALEQTLSGK